MKRSSVFVPTCVVLFAGCLAPDSGTLDVAERVRCSDAGRMKEMLKGVRTWGPADPFEIYAGAGTVLTLLPQVRTMGEAGERALIATFQDRRPRDFEDLFCRLEAAILLAAMESEEGTRMVITFMKAISAAALIDDVGDRKDIFQEILGTRDFGYFIPHLVEIMLALDASKFAGGYELYAVDNIIGKMVHVGYTLPDLRLERTLTERHGRAFIHNDLLRTIKGKQFAIRSGRKTAGYERRLQLSRLVVEKRDLLGRTAKAHAREALKAFMDEAPLHYQEELAGLLKKLGGGEL